MKDTFRGIAVCKPGGLQSVLGWDHNPNVIKPSPDDATLCLTVSSLVIITDVIPSSIVNCGKLVCLINSSGIEGWFAANFFTEIENDSE